MLSSMIFHVLPTALEISMVCAILVGHGAAQIRFAFPDVTNSAFDSRINLVLILRL